jgi:hypothetical protein
MIKNNGELPTTVSNFTSVIERCLLNLRKDVFRIKPLFLTTL